MKNTSRSHSQSFDEGDYVTDQRRLYRVLQIVPARFEEMMRDPDPIRSRRVTDAMLKMIKFDIAALEKAYRS